jgi:hypothetical protein
VDCRLAILIVDCRLAIAGGSITNRHRNPIINRQFFNLQSSIHNLQSSIGNPPIGNRQSAVGN